MSPKLKQLFLLISIFLALSASAAREFARQSTRQQALAALQTSLVRARYAHSYVTKVATSSRMDKGKKNENKSSPFQAVTDCVEQLGDSVDWLRRSTKELSNQRSRESFAWRVSDVQTWVSSAITDDNTCKDGLSAAQAVSRSVKGNIVKVVNDAARATSAALALVNRCAKKQ